MIRQQLLSRWQVWWDRPFFYYFLLAGITLLALVLRFYKLGEWSFWIDEIFTIGRAKAHIDLSNPSTYNQPLSLLFTSVLIQQFGVNEWNARLFSVFIGVISIPVLYLPIRKLFDSKVALVSVLLLALAPWHLFWSQNARYYSTLMLFYAIAAFALYFSIERDKPWLFLIFYVLLYFAIKERLVSLFLLPVIGTYLFSLWLLPWSKPLGFRLSNMVLLISPLLFAALVQAYRFFSTGDFLLIEIFQFFIGQPNISPLRLLAAIVFRLGVPLFVFGSFAGIYMILIKSRAGLFTFISAILPVILLLIFSLFAFTTDRYVFATMPFWTILGALSVTTLFEQLHSHAKLLAMGVLVLLVIASLAELLLYYDFQNGHRPDWKYAFAVVSQNQQEGDLVFATRPEVGEYYLSESVRNVNSLDIDSITTENQRVWFIIDESTGFVEPILEIWIIEHSSLVDVRSVNLPGKSLSIRIYLYDAK